MTANMPTYIFNDSKARLQVASNTYVEAFPHTEQNLRAGRLEGAAAAVRYEAEPGGSWSRPACAA